MALVSCVIPVYRAQDCLEELYSRLVKSLSPLTENFEIVLIDDRSPDASWEGIKRLSQRDPRVRGFRLSKNFGQHKALAAGLDQCDGDWVVVMDCDLQDRPEDIPTLFRKAQEGHGVVRAARAIRADGFLKRVSSAAFYSLFRLLSGLPYDGRSANFRIMKRSVVEHLRLYRENLRFFGALTHIAGHQGIEIPVQHDVRFAGESSYSLVKLIKLGLETILAYSNRPLYLMIGFGFVTSLLSFLAAVVVIYGALTEKFIVQGWASIVASIALFSGLIIFCLGITGLYVGQIFNEVKRRPLYLVEEKT